VQTAVGSVEIVKKGPRVLANLFALWVLLERFEKPSDVAVRDIK
jgi:hypothetical protein